MTIIEALASLNAYPIPTSVLEVITAKRGITGTATFTATTAKQKGYILATADVYAWLADAPNVSQGGQSYSFDANQRKEFKAMSLRIYNGYGDETDKVTGAVFGYRGDSL